MNNRTRIFSKGIQHFQQGGNIYTGSPKPFTNNLPAVNINPVNLANHPIEINTTGITDQINKMRDLAFKREELAFKYKELDYKEGKDYLDLLGDIYKGVGSVKSTVDSAGGIASISPAFKNVFSAYEAKKSEYLNDATRGFMNRDKNSGITAMSKLMALDQEMGINEHKVYAEALNKVINEATMQGGGYGIGTKEVMDGVFGVLQSDKLDYKQVTDLITRANYFKSLKLQVGDETKFLDTFIKPAYEKAAEKQSVTIDPKTGLKTTTIIKVKPDTANLIEAMKARYFGTPEGRAYLDSKGFNPDKRDSPETNAFITEQILAYDKVMASQYAPEIKQDVVEKMIPGYGDTPEGIQAEILKEKSKQAAGVGVNKVDEKMKAREDAAKAMFGDDAYNAQLKTIWTEGGTDWQLKAKEKAEELGISTKDGGGVGVVSIVSPTGDVVDVAPTEENFKKNITINEANPTMFFTDKNGKRFVATVDESVIEMGKQFKFPSEVTAKDKVVKDKMTPEDAKNWDVNPWEGPGWFNGDIYIFELPSNGSSSKTPTPSPGVPADLVDPREAAKGLNQPKGSAPDSTLLKKYFD